MNPALPRRAALAGVTLAASAQAQEPPAATWTVTYVEAAPASQAQVLAALQAEATAMRQEVGFAGMLLLRRIDRPWHFALLDQWRDGAAAAAHRAAPGMTTLRAALAPMLVAPYDERPHVPMAVAGLRPVPGAILVLTHVDVVPTGREAGAAALAAIVPAGRAAPGNLGFDVLIQQSRQNHFTVVEAWADEAALLGHIASPPARTLRTTLGPLGGSLYDERLYRVVA